MSTAGLTLRDRVRGRDDIHVIAAVTAVMAWGIGPILNKSMSVGTPSIVLTRMVLGVPIMVLPGGRAVFGPVVLPVPVGERALELWDLTVSYSRFPGLFEMKTPKTDADMALIGGMFKPYLEARQWPTIMNPAR